MKLVFKHGNTHPPTFSVEIDSSYHSHSTLFSVLTYRFDDLIDEENPILQKAIHRLPAEDKYARVYRQITAHQLALSHELLPPAKAVQPEQDDHYLIPYILEAEKEAFEKAELDNIQV